MAVPVVVEVLETPDGVFTTQVLNTSAATAAGDTLIIWYGSDFYTFASMPNATSSAGTCTLITSVSLGDNVGHQKVFICPVTSGGSKSVTIPAHTDCDIHGVVWRISSTVTADVSATQFDPNNTTDLHVAPSVTTTGADRLLSCCWLTPNGPSWTGEVYAPPASMTKKGETDASPFSAMMAAVEGIATASATGTRTATWVAARKYSAITLALAGPDGGGGVAVTGRSAAVVASQVTTRKVVAVTAVASVSAGATATARKAAPVASVGAAATAAAGVARKVTPAGGVAAVAAASRAAAAKKAPVAGASHAVAWAYQSQVITRPATAVCSAAVTGSAVVCKVLPASGMATTAASGWASSSHAAQVTSLASVGATGRAQTSRISVVTGRGVLAVTGVAAARKTTPVTSRAYALALPVQVVPPEETDLVGSLSSSDGRRAHLATGSGLVATLSSTSSSAVLQGGDE
ncbi:hypothetical protein [Nonomuraea sp. NPDC049400]|uniref:hypothetical protein n=1 Tax=Nonomuraea sp. NPDC049400 TaxID=3364352 RepID=UPI003798C6CF